MYQESEFEDLIWFVTDWLQRRWANVHHFKISYTDKHQWELTYIIGSGPRQEHEVFAVGSSFGELIHVVLDMYEKYEKE